MLIILSPAKKLDFKSKIEFEDFSQNRFLSKASVVVDEIRKLSAVQLADIMSLSNSLAQLTYDRYREWQLPFSIENARQAVFAFNGDAYQGLDAKSFNHNELNFANRHLRILSALYGVIRPYDLIQPYRIEMSMKFSVKEYNSLYDFWGNDIAEVLLQDLKNQEDNIIVNLASEEYFKVLEGKVQGAQIVNCIFKEYSDGGFKIVSQKAKRARGLMSRFIIQNQLSEPEHLKLFDLEGYFFNEKLSFDNNIVFTR